MSTRRRQPDPDAIAALLAKTAPPTDIMRRPLSAGDSSLQWAIDVGKVKPPAPPPPRRPAQQRR